MTPTLESFEITPEDTCLESLSPSEIDALFRESDNIRPLLRRCALAVVSSGTETDDVQTMLDRYRDFDVEVKRTPGAISIVLKNTPMSAFVSYQSPGKTASNTRSSRE